MQYPNLLGMRWVDIPLKINQSLILNDNDLYQFSNTGIKIKSLLNSQNMIRAKGICKTF